MDKKGFDLIPHIVINPTSIVSYNEINYHFPRSRRNSNYIDPEKPIESQSKFISSTRKNDGTLSDNAKRKLSKAIIYLTTVAKEKKVQERLTGKTVTFKCSFLTLTLPSQQIHSDAEIINLCLNSFFNEVRKYHNVKNYVWRSERQKNGNLHFHIVTDAFIPWYDMRNRWNRIINKLGYVDRFQEKHGHRTPNSTDIHSTKKIKNLTKYLIKYLSKTENEALTEDSKEISKKYQSGRIWSCNHELSQTRGLNLVVDSEVSADMKKVIDYTKISHYSGSYFEVYHIDYHSLRDSGADSLFKYFSDYLFEKLHFSEQLTIKQTG